MNVNLNEFLVISRASHIFNTFGNNGADYTKDDLSDNTVSSNSYSQLIHTIREDGTIHPVSEVYNVMKNTKFIIDAIFEGCTTRDYVIFREGGHMELVTLCEFDHKRIDNSEIVKVQLPIMYTNDYVVAVSPFESIYLKERLGANNPFITTLIPIKHLLKIPHINKSILMEYIYTEDVDGSPSSLIDELPPSIPENISLESKIKLKVDAIATSTHMETEYIMSTMKDVGPLDFQAITRDSDLYHYIKHKHNLATTETEEPIQKFDYREILVEEEATYKALVKGVEVDQNRLHEKIYAIESLESAFDLTHITNKSILVDCPEPTVPVIFKLPKDLTYVSYNKVVRETDSTLTTYQLLNYVPGLRDEYIKPEETEDKEDLILGMESTKISNAVNDIKDKAKEKILYPLQRFGIKAGTPLYEHLYPIVRLPINVAKDATTIIFDVFKTESELEKKTADKYLEKALNDELDVWLVKLDVFFQKYALYLAACFITGNVFVAVLGYLFFKSKFDKVRIGALERAERRMVTKIREYEQKMQFATQESDYESVKKLNTIIDAYKAALDNIREVKEKAMGKAEKYSEKYPEYNN